jgi:hypothetical protein
MHDFVVRRSAGRQVAALASGFWRLTGKQRQMRVATMAFIVLLASASSVRAHWDCAAPLADWQPREVLVSKLEAEGWQNIAIRIEDGCYLVHAVNAAGERLHGKFDPARLIQVSIGRGHHGEGEPHEGHHDGDGRGRDQMEDHERDR